MENNHNNFIVSFIESFDIYNLIQYYCESNYKDIIFKEMCYIYENSILIDEAVLSDEVDIDSLTTTEQMILDCIDFYDEHICVPRSIKTTNDEDYNVTQQDKIDLIKSYYQPPQKSDEWYKYRSMLITASSAWKLLHSNASINEFIYNKCKPFNILKYKCVNVNSPFHWGNKYEDVSVSLYEHIYNVKVEDFGCIKHPKYDFLGASPDGIVVSNNRRGRMLEIKNIVNRDITGIPKKEYWIQTQLQMETCDLDDCDFLECRFKEYDTEEEFRADGSFTHTSTRNYKGIMIQFFDGISPIYEYAPFLCDESVFNLWSSSILEKNKENTWIKNIYWHLPEFSCVHIKRNRFWFESVLPIFEESWKIIQKEKKDGFEHRKPKSRSTRKKNTPQNIIFSLETIKQL